MKYLIKSIIVAGALAFAGHQAHAEKFHLTLSAIEFFPDSAQANKIVKVLETNKLIQSREQCEASSRNLYHPEMKRDQ